MTSGWGRGGQIFYDDITKKRDDEEGCIKYCLKLRDVILESRLYLFYGEYFVASKRQNWEF